MASEPASNSARPEGTVAFGSLSEGTAILVLVAVFLAILMGAMDSLVVATVLPRIAVDLHQVNGVTFVVSAYLISSTISIPIFSRLSDITSRRNVFLTGLVVFIAGSACAGLSQNLTELIVFRGIQGFGGGGVFPVAIAMVAVMFPPKIRAQVTGVLAGAAGLAIVLGPLVGSYIVSVTTWRWVFYINLPFGILAILVMMFAVGALRPTTPGSFDAPGAALMTGWVGALMFALVQVADAGWAWTNPAVLALLGTAGVLLGLFLWWETRVKEPLVPLRLLRQRVIAASSGTMLFTGVVFSAFITFLSVFVGLLILHGGPNSAAEVRDIIYFLAIPLVLGATLGGPILNRVPYRVLIAPGLLVASVAAFLLTGLSTSTPLWVLAFGFLPVGGIALPLIPLGLGLGVSLSGTTIAVQNEAPAADVGAAIGLTRFFQSLGGALGISLLTVYLNDAGASLASTYDRIFLVLAACIAIAFVFSLFFVGRVPRTPAEDKEHVIAPSGSPPARDAAPSLVPEVNDPR